MLLSWCWGREKQMTKKKKKMKVIQTWLSLPGELAYTVYIYYYFLENLQ